ncbi:hypothetical protein HHK36_000486 [Tetracentron sinense]|uniref:Uncharacterized protein n=1 Tax=Tetracentron sinense TaxID=13715 RepID=A0A835DR39_TETSI|nr:hypothetical protein HHK36_000486 [Tetracentron sinense]
MKIFCISKSLLSLCLTSSFRCEAFSTHPRTYDLIHASSVFSLYLNKGFGEESGWRHEMDSKMLDHQDAPLVPEKILVAVKQYWVDNGGNSTSHDDELYHWSGEGKVGS